MLSNIMKTDIMRRRATEALTAKAKGATSALCALAMTMSIGSFGLLTGCSSDESDSEEKDLISIESSGFDLSDPEQISFAFSTKNNNDGQLASNVVFIVDACNAIDQSLVSTSVVISAMYPGVETYAAGKMDYSETGQAAANQAAADQAAAELAAQQAADLAAQQAAADQAAAQQAADLAAQQAAAEQAATGQVGATLTSQDTRDASSLGASVDAHSDADPADSPGATSDGVDSDASQSEGVNEDGSITIDSNVPAETLVATGNLGVDITTVDHLKITPMIDAVEWTPTDVKAAQIDDAVKVTEEDSNGVDSAIIFTLDYTVSDSSLFADSLIRAIAIVFDGNGNPIGGSDAITISAEDSDFVIYLEDPPPFVDYKFFFTPAQ